jgi:pantothenate kinase
VTGPLERSDIRSFDAAIMTGRELAESGRRRILGIVGAPGAGRSTVAAALVRELGAGAVLVPMDGFDLAQAELERLGRADRKGAPDTFDAPDVTLVITEGNDLLLDEGGFSDVRELLDEAWFITVADEDRLELLVARHVAGGKSRAAPLAWARGPDQRNAELVAASAPRADRSVSARVVTEVHRQVMGDWAP